MSYQRIAVVGCSGAGKSTLAKVLAERLGLPVVHLDRHFWGPQWTKPADDAWRRTVAELAAADRWVMDGNYGGSLDLRLPRADLVVFLDPPRRTCLSQAIGRYWQYRDKPPRDDLGQVERLNWQHLRYVWSYRRHHRPRLLAKLAAYAPDTPVARLRNRREVRDWLAALTRPAGPVRE